MDGRSGLEGVLLTGPWAIDQGRAVSLSLAVDKAITLPGLLACSVHKHRSRTKNRLHVKSGVAACGNLLHNRELRQQVCATGGVMILGYARVSKGETPDTHLQETALRAG